MKPVAVFGLDASGAVEAEAIVEEFGLPLFLESSLGEKPRKEQLHFFKQKLGSLPALAFITDSEAVHLARIEAQGFVKIRAGFHGSSIDYRREKGGGRSEMIAKAVGLKGGKSPTVIDVTAGLGVDAFVLASLGCRVTMLERVPSVHVLLRCGLERSRKHAANRDAELEAILERMRLVQIDAVEYLSALSEGDTPDVVYLDPMFPERRKSAAVKKEMQIFHKLVGPDSDAESVLGAALRVAHERVVVKRPRTAPGLAGEAPSYVIRGTRNRYDVYLIASSR